MSNGWYPGRFGWGTFGSAAPMFDVLDQEVLNNVQLALIEPANGGASFQSGIWTQAQVLDYLNQRQNRFLSESGVSVLVTYHAGQAGQSRYPVLESVIDIRRIAWATSDNPMAYVELPVATAWEMDHGRTNWPTNSAVYPSVYMEDHLPSLTIEVNEIPNDIGEIEMIAVAQGTQVDGSGVFLSVPDDYTPYLKWGVLADMLAGEYEGNDPVRAKHCEDRFNEGIELARILTGEM